MWLRGCGGCGCGLMSPAQDAALTLLITCPPASLRHALRQPGRGARNGTLGRFGGQREEERGYVVMMEVEWIEKKTVSS